MPPIAPFESECESAFDVTELKETVVIVIYSLIYVYYERELLTVVVETKIAAVVDDGELLGAGLVE
jgi:hypothetical protein